MPCSCGYDDVTLLKWIVLCRHETYVSLVHYGSGKLGLQEQNEVAGGERPGPVAGLAEQPAQCWSCELAASALSSVGRGLLRLSAAPCGSFLVRYICCSAGSTEPEEMQKRGYKTGVQHYQLSCSMSKTDTPRLTWASFLQTWGMYLRCIPGFREAKQWYPCWLSEGLA